MRKKAASGIMLVLLTISIVSLVTNVKPVKSEWTGTVYIRADGSIDPPNAPIITYDNVTYTLIDNITSTANGIVVERDNIIIDGDGYAIQRVDFWGFKGITISGRINVTIKDINIKGFYYGIYLDYSLRNCIIGNNFEDNHWCIYLSYSSNNSICRNNIKNELYGISLYGSSNNTVRNNQIVGNNKTIAHTNYGIELGGSHHNIISGNNIKDNYCGVLITNASDNIFNNNGIIGNIYGILFSSDRRFIVIDINNDNSPQKAPGYLNPVYPNPCGDPDFRRALWHTINRTYIIAEFWNDSALPMYTPIHPELGEFVHPDIVPGGALENLTYSYNLTKAAQILDEAGFIDTNSDGWRNFPEELGGDGANIILKYFIRSDDPERKALGLWHADQLESIGIKINRVLGDFHTAFQEVIQYKNFSLYTGGWYGGVPDPSITLETWHSHNYLHPELCSNYDRVNCSAYDYWVDKTIEFEFLTEAKEFEKIRYAALKAQEAFNSPNCLGAIPICGLIRYEEGSNDNSFFSNLIARNIFGFKLAYSLNNSIYEKVVAIHFTKNGFFASSNKTKNATAYYYFKNFDDGLSIAKTVSFHKSCGYQPIKWSGNHIAAYPFSSSLFAVFGISSMSGKVGATVPKSMTKFNGNII